MSEMTLYMTSVFGSGATERMQEYVSTANVKIIGGVAGSVSCPSCAAGSDYNDVSPYQRGSGCIECKNTGRVLVSI